MPYVIDETDTAIIKSLMADGRKSFRQISRELKISTPTIKARYERLVHIGLVKSVVPIIDTTKLEKRTAKKLEGCKCTGDYSDPDLSEMNVKMKCDYCDIDIAGKPQVLKFADMERFFCCTSCKSLYKEKHKGRIESLKQRSF